MRLPFETAPLLNHYLGKAYSLGIIQGNAGDRSLPWIYSRYINCIFHPSAENQFDFYTPDYWGRSDHILTEQRMQLQRETYGIMGLDILRFVRDLLDRGVYVYGTNNERYIPGKSSYPSQDYLHEYILFGYSDDKHSFLSCGYLADRHYREFEILYDDYLRSLMNTTDGMIKFSFWQYCQQAEFALDIPHIVVELSDYLHSVNTQRVQQNGLHYGLDAVIKLMECLAKQIRNEGRADIRYTKAFLGHKKLMSQRLQYLRTVGFGMEPDWLEQTAEHEKKAEQIHLLCIRQNFKGTPSSAEYIEKRFTEILQGERHILPAVLERLKSG